MEMQSLHHVYGSQSTGQNSNTLDSIDSNAVGAVREHLAGSSRDFAGNSDDFAGNNHTKEDEAIGDIDDGGNVLDNLAGSNQDFAGNFEDKAHVSDKLKETLDAEESQGLKRSMCVCVCLCVYVFVYACMYMYVCVCVCTIQKRASMLGRAKI